MEYELFNLEAIVNRLHLQKGNKEFVNEVLEELILMTQTEEKRIKNSIVNQILNQSRDQLLRQFIHQHHKGLVKLVDKLLLTIERDSKIKKLHHHNKLVGVEKTIYLVIEGLLHWLEKRYPEYISPHFEVPIKYKSLVLKEMQLKMDCIIAKEKKISNLIICAFTIVQQSLNDMKRPLTYSGLIFRKEIIYAIERAIKLKEEKLIDEELIKAFIKTNFNSEFFINYLIDKLKKEIDSEEGLQQKVERLFLELKLLNQTPILPNLALNFKEPHIKESLTQWILEEICFLEKKLKIQGNSDRINNFVDNGIKIITDLSVPQIACFLKVLIEVDIIKNKNKEEVIRFYSTHYRSKKIGAFTSGSLRSKYYAVQDSAKEDMKAYIIKMLNELKKI